MVYSNTIINHPKKLNLLKKKSEYNHLTIISRVKKKNNKINKFNGSKSCTWIMFHVETDKEVAASKMPPRTQCSGVEEKMKSCCLNWRVHGEETDVLSISVPW